MASSAASENPVLCKMSTTSCLGSCITTTKFSAA